MPFDPDAYLKEKSSFDPDAYLSDKTGYDTPEQIARAKQLGIPYREAPDAPPSIGQRLKDAAMTIPHAGEAALRMVGGGLGGLAGGAQGALEWLDPQMRKSGVTPASGFDAGAQGANRLIDKVIGPTSSGADDMMRALGDSQELQALAGMNPVEGALLAGSGKMAKPVIAANAGRAMDAIPGAVSKAVSPIASVPGKVRGVLDEARGNVAKGSAEELRSRASVMAENRANAAKDAAEKAQADATRAGLDAEHSAAWGQAATQHLENTEKIGEAIEQKLLAQPNMSKEQFGGMLRAAAKTLHETKSAERMKASGYSAALQQDATKTVNTGSVRKIIDENEAGIANPNLRATLDSIKAELRPQGAPPPVSILGPNGKPLSTIDTGLPLQNADSLRKYLDGIIQTKTVKVGNSSMAVDKESLRAVQDIRSSLVDAMDATSPALKEARKKWRELSRGELDRLEGKGDLAQTIKSDSISGEYKLTEAEVAGSIIRRANAGSASLAMLAKSQPGLKEAGRLYFTGELFGKGAVPSPAVMDTFLKTNQRALKQLGLYDEFKDVASAQRARAKTLADARESVKGADQAQREAERTQGAAQRSADQSQRLNERYRTLQTELMAADAKDIPGKVKTFAKSMVDDGLITQDQYGSILKDAEGVSGKFADAKARRALLLKIGAYTGAGLVGSTAINKALGN